MNRDAVPAQSMTQAVGCCGKTCWPAKGQRMTALPIQCSANHLALLLGMDGHAQCSDGIAGCACCKPYGLSGHPLCEEGCSICHSAPGGVNDQHHHPWLVPKHLVNNELACIFPEGSPLNCAIGLWCTESADCNHSRAA